MIQLIVNKIQLLKRMKSNSIFYKYLRKLLPLTLIPFILICGVFYIIYARSVDNELSYLLNQSHQRNAIAIDATLKDIEQGYIELQILPATQYFLTTSNNTVYGMQINNWVTDISKTINQIQRNSGCIDSVEIYSILNDYLLSNNTTNSMQYDLQWYKEFKENNITNSILYQPNVASRAGKSLIYFSYAIEYNNTPYGIICFSIDVKKLEELLSYKHDKDFYKFALLRKDGSIIYSNLSKYGEDFLKNKRSDAITDQESYSTINNQAIAAYTKLQLSNLYLASIANTEFISGSKQTVQLILILLILVAFIIPVIISIYISMKIYQLIGTITQQIKSVVNPTASETDKFDEITYINNNLMQLVKDKDNAEQTLIENIALLKKVQSMALQLQISPHFLFNTINVVSIITTNIAGPDNPAEEMLSLLSDILYYVLNTDEYLVDFEKEIEFTQKYIQIEKIKFQDGFDVEWNIDQSIPKDCKVAKFMLQPIIENAFEHAIKTLYDRRGVLKINVKAHRNKLVFHISDNGNGIDPVTLKQIKGFLKSTNLQNTSHIGLYNVNSRIKMFFGDSYGVSISSQNTGTDVKIVIPNVS